MLTASKQNNAVTVTYASVDFNSTATVTMDVLNQNNVLISGSPFTLTETASTGIYEGVFTPTTMGTYKILIFENGSTSSAASIEITQYDIDTVGTLVAGIAFPTLSAGGYIP